MNSEKQDNINIPEDEDYSKSSTLKKTAAEIWHILRLSPEKIITEKPEEKVRMIRRGAELAMFFLLGFLFECARLPFGAYPFAAAIVGASSSYTVTIALGQLASIAVNGMPFSHFLSLIILLIMRLIGRMLLERPSTRFSDDPSSFIKYELFSESVFLRMSAVSVSVFSIGLYTIIENNFMYYDLWGALLGMVVAPVAAYIFSFFFDSEARNLRSIALLSFTVCAVYSLKQFEGLGGFLAIAASQVILLCMLRKIPPLYSLSLSLLLGAICGITYIPMFFFSGIAYIIVLVFLKTSENTALLTSLVTSALWGFAVNGKSAFYTVFPALLAAAAADNLIKAVLPGITASENFIPARIRQNLLTTRENEEKLERMSESFKKLSEAFKRLSDRLSRPGLYEIRKECDDVLDSFCTDCKNAGICWGEDYNTTIGFLNDAGNHLTNHGHLDSSIIPDSLASRCGKTNEIIEKINQSVKALYRDSLEKEKLAVFSSDYSSLSRIISDNIDEKQQENSENRELSAKALNMLGKHKNDFHTVSVWGKRKIRVFARLKTVTESTVGMREFKRLMEECCNCAFQNPVLKIEGKSMTITLSVKPIFSADAGSARISAGNLPLCGDSPSYFEGHDGYFYALISDGMGTGANAALASGICEVFLKEMLEGGNHIDTSVDMLNTVIASKGNECSATVDIMELDTFSGNCTFLKSGAASSFILRDGSVYKLSARTMPLGILDEADTDMQKVRLLAGDIVFLVSDGAAPKENYDNLISVIKCSSPHDSPETLAQRVIENTKQYSKDDISCVVVKISGI